MTIVLRHVSLCSLKLEGNDSNDQSNKEGRIKKDTGENILGNLPVPERC
jgi:hypothetical protein